MPADVHATAGARLEDVEQRYTPRRRALVELLFAAGRPLSIPEIVRGRSDLPQSSVYRNLAVLEQAGVVCRVLTDDEFARYELSEELTQHHHHLLCVSCGTVADVTVPVSLERTVARAIDEVAAATGFRAVRHRLDLIGLCARCAPR